MRHILRSLLAVTALVASAAAMHALAQNAWPNRPIKLVIPFLAGGAADIIARAYADQVGAALGQSMVVENRGGAGGNIAATAVVKSAPDGYTLFFGSTGPSALNSLMYKNLALDPMKDFTPIILVGKTPVIIAARPDAPFKSLQEVMTYARANPEKLTSGFPGNGTLGHITGVLFGQRAGVAIKHVQYRGGAAIITDLLGGHIDLAMDALTPYVPMIQDGKLRGLAVGSATRLKELPDVPTASEAGLKDFEASVWYCVLAPAGLPAEIVTKLNAVSNTFLNSEKSKELLATMGALPAGGTSDELRNFMAKELATWGPVIREAKIEF